MPLHVKIVDSNGNPDPISSLSDLLVESILEKGVGFFRTSAHVANDIRAVVNELLRADVVVVNPPTLLQVCPSCFNSVSVWHTYADGFILCTSCKPKVGHE